MRSRYAPNTTRPLASRPAALATALAVAATGLLPLLAAGPAQAALSGTDWAEQALPASYVVADGSDGPALSPVSCLPGSQFCVAIVSDLANLIHGSVIGQAAVVTTDGGQHWTGYATLPSTLQITAISCASTSVCWASGSGEGGTPRLAETTDGGQTWTDVTPAAWSGATWLANGIDCVSPATCWVVGSDSGLTVPAVAETTDGGATWSMFANIPAPAISDPNGTYALNGISCVSALSCVAVGGRNETGGTASVFTTTDGGTTWAASTDPALAGIEDLFGVSCLPGTGGLPVCHAAGSALQAAGPVEITSGDGGATWSGMETLDNTGWLNSVSCPDSQHCWGAGSGTTVALVGTGDGGTSWSSVSAETTNEDGSASCLSASVCVATTDNGLWVTSDGGGLPARPAAGHLAAGAGPGAAGPVTRTLPRVSPHHLPARAGSTVTVVGQFRGPRTTKTVSATITPPTGPVVKKTATIGLNDYFSFSLPTVATGLTKVRFTVGKAKAGSVTVHGYPAAAPSVSRLSVQAGPAAGGTKVTITGSHFTGATQVMFGPPSARHPGTGLTVVSATKLKVLTPAGTGAGYVTVTTARGGPSALTGRAVYNFLPPPAVTGLSPGSGPAGGGTTVTITGTGFGYVRPVHFGSTLATDVQVLSRQSLTVVAPAGAGTVTVTVTTAGGTSASTPAASYTY